MTKKQAEMLADLIDGLIQARIRDATEDSADSCCGVDYWTPKQKLVEFLAKERWK